MKQVFILIDKADLKEILSLDGFYDRKEMYQHEADRLNSSLVGTVWVLQPNY